MKQFDAYVNSMSKPCCKIYKHAVKMTGNRTREFLELLTSEDMWVAYLSEVKSEADVGGVIDLISSEEANIYA